MPQYPFTAINNDLGALITLTAAGLGTLTSADQKNGQGGGVKVVVDITAITGTGATLTVHIRGKDKASGTYEDLLVSAGLIATGITVLTIYPGITATSNVAASDHLPLTWDITAVITGTGPSVTGTIGACLMA